MSSPAIIKDSPFRAPSVRRGGGGESRREGRKGKTLKRKREEGGRKGEKKGRGKTKAELPRREALQRLGRGRRGPPSFLPPFRIPAGRGSGGQRGRRERDGKERSRSTARRSAPIAGGAAPPHGFVRLRLLSFPPPQSGATLHHYIPPPPFLGRGKSNWGGGQNPTGCQKGRWVTLRPMGRRIEARRERRDGEGARGGGGETWGVPGWGQRRGGLDLHGGSRIQRMTPKNGLEGNRAVMNAR